MACMRHMLDSVLAPSRPNLGPNGYVQCTWYNVVTARKQAAGDIAALQYRRQDESRSAGIFREGQRHAWCGMSAIDDGAVVASAAN